jgi:hypothetical protein
VFPDADDLSRRSFLVRLRGRRQLSRPIPIRARLIDLDDLTFGPGPFLGDTFRTNREIQMLKVGLNYRFGYGGPGYGGPGYGGPGYGGPGYRAY